MGWLRSLFASQETVTRLRRERDFHRDNAHELTRDKAALEKKLEASEAALIREINSNRRREDAYKDQISELSTGQNRLPWREELGQGTERQPARAELDAPEPVDRDFEAAVDNLAKEFAENALAGQGLKYGPEQMEILKETIRRNRHDYGL